MAKNEMKPYQDLLTRRFFKEVALDAEALMPGAPASARQLRALCLFLLNYDQLPNGAFVEKGTNVSYPFGNADYNKYKDEWEDDLAATKEKLNETDNDKDTVEASTSESTEGTEVRTSVLPEDVQQVAEGRPQTDRGGDEPASNPSGGRLSVRDTESEDKQAGGAVGGRGQLREGTVRLPDSEGVSTGRQVDNDGPLEEEVPATRDGRVYPDNSNG